MRKVSMQFVWVLASVLLFSMTFVTGASADNRGDILIYIISNGVDSIDGPWQWYTGPNDLNEVIYHLNARGYKVDVWDEIMRPADRSDTATMVKRFLAYDQVWILDSDGDTTVDVTPQETEALAQYYQKGGRIWISVEQSPVWADDGSAFSSHFGVTVNQSAISGNDYLKLP